MKPEDFAQEIELKEYENTQRRAILPKRPSLSHCEDCGDEIAPARREATFVTRCVICQAGFESLRKKGNL